MRKTGLRIQLFITYLLLSLAIVGVFSAVFYFYTSQILLEREIEKNIGMVENFRDQTDQAVKSMDNLSVNMAFTLNSFNKLGGMEIGPNFNARTEPQEVSGQGLDSDALWSQYSSISRLADFFAAVNGSDFPADQLNIYDLNGNVIRVGLSSVQKKVNLEEADWYQPTLALDGRKYLTLPYATSAFVKSSGVDNDYISLFRTYRNRNGNEVGIIETVQQCKTVFKSASAFRKNAENGLSVYVFSQQGDLVYPYGRADGDKELSRYFDARVPGTDHAVFNDPTGGKMLLTYVTSNFTGWTYVTVQDEGVVLRPVNTLIQTLCVLALVMVAVIVLLSFLMSRWLTRPIQRLRNIIHSTQLETLGEEKSFSASFNELEELNQAYQKMSNDLRKSMEDLLESRQQELRSRGLALQSQINPHFYYNTLSNVIALAENGRSDEVVTMCRSLTKMMRYITGSRPSVSLREELSYISNYLYCMKVRHQSNLTCEIQVEDSLLELQVPRLIIQPLVENALKYGTAGEPPWRITVTGRMDGEGWQITVADTGAGFSPESTALMLDRMKQADVGKAEMEINGMGLLNVYSRWRIFQGESAVFEFGSLETGGGYVTIGNKSEREG